MDIYCKINKEWLNNVIIPDDDNKIDNFRMTEDMIDHKLLDLIKKLDNEHIIKKTFDLLLNQRKTNRTKDLIPMLKNIMECKNMDDIFKL